MLKLQALDPCIELLRRQFSLEAIQAGGPEFIHGSSREGFAGSGRIGFVVLPEALH